jgi:hypothetical protein
MPFRDDEYVMRAAKNEEEAKPLIEGSFEHVCNIDTGIMLFRKRK